MPSWIFLAASMLVLTCGSAGARSLTLTAQRLHDAHADAQDLRVTLVEDSNEGSLQFSAGHLVIPGLALAGRVEWKCMLAREADGTRRCAGPVIFTTDDAFAQTADLTAAISRQGIALGIAHAASHVDVAIPFSDQQPVHAVLRKVSAPWLKAPLAQTWHGGELRNGVFDADANLHRDGSVDLRYTASELTFNTIDGTVSGEDLSLTGQLTSSAQASGRRLQVDATIAAGSLHVGNMRARLPDSPVEASLDMSSRDDGLWDIARFAWHDVEALAFEASGELDPAAMAPLRRLSLHVDRAQFPLAMQRYAGGLLAAEGLGKIALKGEIAGDIALDTQGLQRVALASSAFDVDDGSGRIALKGLRGGIDWSATGECMASNLAWKSGHVGGLALSAASSRWQSRDGVLRMLGSLRTKLLGGTLTLSETVLYPRPRRGEFLRSAFALDRIGYDSPDGKLAAAGVKADGALSVLFHSNQPQVELDAAFRGGEFLLDPAYVKLPATPIMVTLDATLAGSSWRIDTFAWSDPGVLDVGASGEVAPADAHPLRALRLDVREAKLAVALERYAHGWLVSKGYGGLRGSGSLAGSLTFDADGLQRFAFNASTVDLHDGDGRFALSGLEGGVDWDARSDAPATTLGWKSLDLFRIPFAAATATLESRQGRVVLANALDIGVLGGKVRIEKLNLQPRSPRGERYAGSFAIAGIEMAQLSAALGWPRFGGNLSGGIPEIEFAGDTIQLHGGLDLYVFDGHLGVSGLTLQHPFSDLPVLGADVHFENFDLDQVTSAFSFGGMSGRLSGTIGQLSLLNWSPVAFDAWLRTVGGGRMSYKAINDVTAIAGGGGLSDNMQTMALKLVNTFGYGRLGLRCRLRDEVCMMGGIDPIPPDAATRPADDDYTIVEGSGLPRITIVGHRRRVDWPTLVRRLQAAVEGQAPVVQ